MKKLLGFTLIELMVVIAIVAILTTLAAPSFKNLIQSNTISSTVNSFLADMRYARSESIRRGGGVVMCRSNAPESSSPACDGTTGAGSGWVTGWIIFHDANGNGAIDSAEILRVQAPITAIDKILDSASSPKYKFPFTATGRIPLSNAASLQFGGSKYPNTAQRTVCISVGGRARIAGDGYASCS